MRGPLVGVSGLKCSWGQTARTPLNATEALCLGYSNARAGMRVKFQCLSICSTLKQTMLLPLFREAVRDISVTTGKKRISTPTTAAIQQGFSKVS
jgi:hypothetical protein